MSFDDLRFLLRFSSTQRNADESGQYCDGERGTTAHGYLLSVVRRTLVGCFPRPPRVTEEYRIQRDSKGNTASFHDREKSASSVMRLDPSTLMAIEIAGARWQSTERPEPAIISRVI